MKAEINIREFKLEEYELLIDLWKQAGLPFKKSGRDSIENMTREFKHGCATVLIAEYQERAIGTVFITHDGRKGWINRLAVIPGYRRKGIGTILVHEAEKVLHSQGIGIIACLIEDYNKASFETFVKLGYIDFEGIHYLTKRTHPDI